MPLPVAAILGAITATAGIAASSADNRRAIEAQNAANQMNMQLSRDQMKWSEKMWNLQNAYNDPQKQLDRLKAAGLNPHLIYGTSPSSAVGAANSPQGYSKADVESTHKGITQFQDMVNSVARGVEYTVTQAQLKNMEQERLLRAMQTLNSAIDADQKSHDLGISKELRGVSIDAAKANLEKLKQDARRATADADVAVNTSDPRIRTAKIAVDSALKNLEGQKLENAIKKAELILRQSGVNNSDSVILRLIMQSKYGEVIKQFLN